MVMLVTLPLNNKALSTNFSRNRFTLRGVFYTQQSNGFYIKLKLQTCYKHVTIVGGECDEPTLKETIGGYQTSKRSILLNV